MSTLKNMAYALADIALLQKGIPRQISGQRVYFPAKWARYFEADYEQDNIAFLKAHCKPGMTVIDIGAHIGLMSVIMARLVSPGGAVYAFEPTPATFALFKKICQINGVQQTVHPQQAAVAGFVGEIDFFIDSNEGSNANSLVSRSDKPRQAQKTKVTTLDDFVVQKNIAQLGLVKIDAEGSELDVLRGAYKSLATLRPRIVLAMHPPLIKNNGHSVEDIFDLLMDLKYQVYYKNGQLSKVQFCDQKDFFDVHLIPQA